MAIPYVKFRRGLLSEFINLQDKNSDTLYFIVNDDDTSSEKGSIDIYLGATLITGGTSGGAGGSASFTGFLNDLQDVKINRETLSNNDTLVYNIESNQWENLHTAITVIENIDKKEHFELIEEKYPREKEIYPNHGDILIIKDPIFTKDGAQTKYSYSSYVYNKDSYRWEAFSGDYNAENVYFDSDFIVTEEIGTISLAEGEGFKTLEATGKNLKEVLSNLLAVEKNPEIVYPSGSIELIGQKEFEVGTYFTPEIKITFDPGSYSYDPNTEVQAMNCGIVDSNNMPFSMILSFEEEKNECSATLTDSAFYIEDSTEYSISSGAITHSDGIVPHTNFGNDYSYGQILESEIRCSVSGIIKGYRNCYYKAFDEKVDIDAALLKTLDHAKVGQSQYTITLPKNTQRIIFAYPQLSDEEYLSVLDVNGLNAEIGNSFLLNSVVNIGGVDNYDEVPYNVYVLDYGKPISMANKYLVSIKRGNN